MVSHIHYNLNPNKDFIVVFTSNFITCFIEIHLYAFKVTSGMKSSQLLVYLGEVNTYTKYWASR